MTQAYRWGSKGWMGAVLVASLLLSVSCGSKQPPPSDIGKPGLSVGTQDDSGVTQVAILGTLHGVHLGSQGFSLDVIEKTVAAYGPDVVLVEIPPDRFKAAVEEVDKLGDKVARDVIEDDWLKAFPELYAVVIPNRKELGYELHPVSGWVEEVSEDRQAYWKAHPRGPKDKTYQQAQASFAEEFARNRGAENPVWINGPEYLELSGTMYEALSKTAEKELGAAGVEKVNEAHWSYIHDAIKNFHGRKVLLVFGALHRWYLEPRIKSMAEVRFVDIAAFLPSE